MTRKKLSFSWKVGRSCWKITKQLGDWRVELYGRHVVMKILNYSKHMLKGVIWAILFGVFLFSREAWFPLLRVYQIWEWATLNLFSKLKKVLPLLKLFEFLNSFPTLSMKKIIELWWWRSPQMNFLSFSTIFKKTKSRFEWVACWVLFRPILPPRRGSLAAHQRISHIRWDVRPFQLYLYSSNPWDGQSTILRWLQAYFSVQYFLQSSSKSHS